MREFHANGLIYRMPEWFDCIRPHYRGEARRLVSSIRDHGQLQPIVLAMTGKKDTYDLVDGLGRLVACFNLELVPYLAFAKEGSDLKALRLDLNLQRRQLLAEEMVPLRKPGKEKAQEAPPLKDESGFLLPARVQEAFTGRSEIFHLAGEILKIQRRVSDLAKKPAASDLLAKQVATGLDHAGRLLRSGAPAYLCPTCMGEKPGIPPIGCHDCMGRGWFSTLGYRAYKRRMKP